VQDRSRPRRKFLDGKIYASRPVGKPKDRWTDTVTRDARRLLGTAEWKTLALDGEIWGRRIEESRARNWTVMP
jgi:hypothetical protein